MTDDDLIHHLRHSKGWPTLGNAAADRIEALIRERDALTDALVDAEARAEAAEAERDRLAELVEEAKGALEKLPPGEWEVWTSCSFQRITARGGPDGGVLHALTHISDGHPDLSWNERQCQALCDLVNGIRATLSKMDANLIRLQRRGQGQ